jgi:hypothetical protein
VREFILAGPPIKGTENLFSGSSIKAKMKKVFLLILFLFFCASYSLAQTSEFRRVRGYDTKAYNVKFNPYPMEIGRAVEMRVIAPYNPVSVTYVMDKKTIFPLKFEEGAWRAGIVPPEYLKEGWNLTFVYIKYKRSDLDTAATKKAMAFFEKVFSAVKLTTFKENIFIEGKVWIRAFRVPETSTLEAQEYVPDNIVSMESMATYEAGPVTIYSATDEVIPSSMEGYSLFPGGLKIKGSKSINFVSRSIEGSKEGFAGGYTREEALRMNISGKIDSETDVDANFISTSSSGTTTTTMSEDKVSILVRRASTEVYYGDFMSDMNDTEFARLNKSLSGIKMVGNYDKWGFKALYSTPRGQPKHYRAYGDNTQGPFNLGNAPVVVDSDRITLNGVEQKRGDDYTIDYNAGTITFRKGIVLNTWIIEADYDWRETLYQHETMGFRYHQQVSGDMKLGITLLNDSDNLYKASEIRDTLSGTVEPYSHYVIGVDSAGKIGNTAYNSEIAYSNRDNNILEAGKDVAIGKAAKLETSTDFAPFTLQTQVKRVGPQFLAVSDSSPKQDVTQYGGVLGFRPTGDYFSEINYGYDKYMLTGVKYLTEDKGFKSKYTPNDLPSLNYFYRQTEDSNDPVSGDLISRLTTKNNVESSFRYWVLNSTLAGGIEERVNHQPSLETTTYKTVSFGTATYGLEKLSASGNVELKETSLPDKSTPYTKTYNANVSLTPDRRYFGSLSLQLVDDSVQGQTDVTDLNYRAAPYDQFSTDGKYTITSIKEDFSGTMEPVSKQSGSFRVDYRPNELVRTRYYFKPNFTRVETTKTYSYTDFTNQAELTYTPIREMSTGLVYKTQNVMNIDRTDVELERESNRRKTYDTTFLIKSAPLRFLSLEFNYLTSDLLLTEQTTIGASAYNHTLGNTKQYSLNGKTSLSETFSIDTNYTWQDQRQGSDAVASNIDTLTNTIFLKGLWNFNENWTYFATYSYSESVNRLLVDDNITYTIMPGLGITYRLREIFRVDTEYTRSQSYAASLAEVDTYTIKLKYDPNEYVHMNLRGSREICVEPNYKNSEIMGSLEIVL